MVQLPVDDSRQGGGIEPSAVVQWKENAFSFITVPHSMAGFIFWRNAMARWNVQSEVRIRTQIKTPKGYVPRNELGKYTITRG